MSTTPTPLGLNELLRLQHVFKKSATHWEKDNTILNWLEDQIAQHQKEHYYRAGLEAAAQYLENLAREGGGGAGITDEHTQHLAERIRKINPHTGY